eukprot:NODE_6200_length_870_cov_112.131191_g5968_i0.p1 GENE.NODE_6200_length_870_cov_112.131191_g5968_i0~~NODE_6200_length_870_cov_112.131191_g5968_i0.p1  ORF type:complete len:237 (+),score=66.51 NODE_6200_length_870_cov_112.131191_g5968_i0:55-711(+)
MIERFVHGKLLRMLGFLGLGASAFVGIWAIIQGSPSGIRAFILLLWVPILGVLGMVAELGWQTMMKKVEFLRNWTSKAMLYIFIGTICLGETIAGWIVGAYMCALGILIIYVRVHHPGTLDDILAPEEQAARSTATISNKLSKKEMKDMAEKEKRAAKEQAKLAKEKAKQEMKDGKDKARSEFLDLENAAVEEVNVALDFANSAASSATNTAQGFTYK